MGVPTRPLPGRFIVHFVHFFHYAAAPSPRPALLIRPIRLIRVPPPPPPFISPPQNKAPSCPLFVLFVYFVVIFSPL